MAKASLFMMAATAASAAAECTREMLQDITESYLAALEAGEPAIIPLAEGATYAENDEVMDIASGVMAEPISIDLSRTLLDTTQCAAMAEIDAASSAHPYVIHTQLQVDDDGNVNKIESVVTDEGDWLFNATAHLEWNEKETWMPIPEDERDSREEIQAVVDAYLDNWASPDLPVPHGTPCARLEAGIYTGEENMDGNTCDMGAFPEPIDANNRRYVIDEVIGAVDVLNNFPWLEITLEAGEHTASSNMLRVEHGKTRYIHEITVCISDSCGRQPPPPEEPAEETGESSEEE